MTLNEWWASVVNVYYLMHGLAVVVIGLGRDRQQEQFDNKSTWVGLTTRRPPNRRRAGRISVHEENEALRRSQTITGLTADDPESTSRMKISNCISDTEDESFELID